MSRREFRDRPRQVAKFQVGQSAYIKKWDRWVVVQEVKFWGDGTPYYWVENKDGSSAAVPQDSLS